ncbi:MAG: hypothetical protein AAF125_15745 [Chloroflexota bacterium]
MMNNDVKQEAADHFRNVLITVVGQAFSAAGYQLEDAPIKQRAGLFRFRKALANGLYGFIEFQLLYLPATEWSGNVTSRFRVSVVRSDKSDAQSHSTHPQYARKTLSELVVIDFGVNILPSADHWWMFDNTDALGKALAEAGHLVVGYGMPWLAGDIEAG